MKAPEGPSRVPTDNPEFSRLVSAIALTISQHQPVRRGDGKVGMTCRFRLCREPIFLTRGDGANHQSFEIIRTIREAAADTALGEDAEDDARALGDLVNLLGLDAVIPRPLPPGNPVDAEKLVAMEPGSLTITSDIVSPAESGRSW